MKTTTSSTTVPKHLVVVLAILTILTLLVHDTAAQALSSRTTDANFPAKGKFNAGVITTYTGIAPPPAIVFDATYGVRNRFSAGVIGGTTGAIALYGIKLNGVVIQKRNFRVVSRVMSLYYPERHGKFMFDRSDKHIMAWMLSMGTLDAEYVTDNGIRYMVGAGLLETNCVAGLRHWLGSGREEKNLPFEWFHTIQGSVSVPVSSRLIIRPEVIMVMKDWSLVEKGAFKVFPINPYIKLVYNF